MLQEQARTKRDSNKQERHRVAADQIYLDSGEAENTASRRRVRRYLTARARSFKERSNADFT